MVLYPPRDIFVCERRIVTTSMIHRFLLLAGSALTMGPLALQAGGFSAEYPETKKKESPGDWCETLQDFGTLYDVKKKIDIIAS